MKYICEQYFDWIKKFVEPRDVIAHYRDMPVVLEVEEVEGEAKIVPKHVFEKRSNETDQSAGPNIKRIEDIYNIVGKYKLVD